MKNLVLLEFADEAEAFLNFIEDQKQHLKDFHIIALQPEVQIYLKKKGIPFENTLNYFPNESHEKLLLKSEEWLNRLTDKIEITDTSGLKKAYTNSFFFYLRFYINHFLYYVEILKNATKQLNVKKVYSFQYINHIHSSSNPHIKDNERFLGAISKYFCEFNGIYWVPLKGKETNFQKMKKENSRDLIGYFYKLFLLYKNPSNIILLPSIGYNIEDLSEKINYQLPNINWLSISDEPSLKSLYKLIYFRLNRLLRRRRGCKIYPIPLKIFQSENMRPDSLLETNLKKASDAIVSANILYENTNFNKVFFDKIEKDLIPYIIRLYSLSHSIKNVISIFDIKACISPIARTIPLLTSEICGDVIPTIIISHGTLRLPQNKYEKIEIEHLGESLTLSRAFKFAAIQTRGEAQLLKAKNRVNKIMSGPLLLSKIEPLSNKNHKIILYPENTRIRKGYRFYVFETFDEFLKKIKDIILTIEDMDKVRLVIRLHPNKNISPDDMRLLLPHSGKIEISPEKLPFYKDLSRADLVIGYSSTAIDDALRNNIPVILYDPFLRYQHYFASELKADESENPVFYVKDSRELKKINILINNTKQIKGYDKYILSEKYFSSFITFLKDVLNTHSIENSPIVMDEKIQ